MKLFWLMGPTEAGGGSLSCFYGDLWFGGGGDKHVCVFFLRLQPDDLSGLGFSLPPWGPRGPARQHDPVRAGNGMMLYKQNKQLPSEIPGTRAGSPEPTSGWGW